MNKPNTVEVLSEFAKTVAILSEKVDSLALKIESKPDESKVESRKLEGVNLPEIPENDALSLALDGPSEPVSPVIRAIVDQTLNKSFGIHIKSEIGAFRFTILVPDKYSSLSADKKQFCKFDMRPKVIENAEGVNGVKAWCETVLNNFDQSMQGIIVSDRLANP